MTQPPTYAPSWTCPKLPLPDVAQLATLLWHRLESPSLEHFTLLSRANGFRLVGTVVLELDGKPSLVTYTVDTDTTWLTRAVTVDLKWAGKDTRLELRVDDDQRWWQGKRELTALMGRADVDLSVTPATNTLPLRRLGLGVGESAEVTAAWVKFPELEVEPLPQRYTRLSNRHYRYQSGRSHTEFVADVTVDTESLVTDYRHSGASGWLRVPHTHIS